MAQQFFYCCVFLCPEGTDDMKNCSVLLLRRDKTNRKTANYNRRQSFFSKVCLLFGFFSYLLFVVNEEKKVR